MLAAVQVGVEAVQDHVFELSLDVSQTIRRPIEADHIHGGEWFEAHHDDYDETFRLHVSDKFDAPKPQSTWRGKMSMIGLTDAGEIIATIAEA